MLDLSTDQLAAHGASAGPPALSWQHELAGRIRWHFPLKCAGITAFISLFFVGYLYLQQHPAFAVTTMPLTRLDRAIAFEPYALVVYLSLWLYIGAAPALQRTFRELGVYALWISALGISGLGIFYLWPTAVPAQSLDPTSFPGFAMLKRVDAAGNACPSMHVAAAMFTMIRVGDLLRWSRSPWTLRLLNVAWFAAIAWSTVATRQHVIADVAAGAALGLLFAALSLAWLPKRSDPIDPPASRC